MDIWRICNGATHVHRLDASGFRVVESQSRSSTMKLVDNIHEQTILEEIIEEHKPPLPEGAENIHFLYSTPFRYPPLQYGSRFGTVEESSLFYGAEQEKTAFAEKAYYQLKFFKDARADFEPCNLPLTVFAFNAASDKALDLTVPPFSTYRTQISDKDSYSMSQPLGKAMRAAGIELFTFVSARCPEEGKNIGIYTWRIFKNKNRNPKFLNYNSFLDNDSFTIYETTSRGVRYSFTRTQFGL